MEYFKEVEGKRFHDVVYDDDQKKKKKSEGEWVKGAVIVGAGPSGLAVAACLKEKGMQSIILERANCLASMWQLKTYDRLRLHLPKQFCELPLMPFPSNFPSYPSKQQFVAYLKSYASRFDLKPVFGTKVVSAMYDKEDQCWRVKSVREEGEEEREYKCRWLVAATGENAEEVVPEMEGMGEFGGRIVHTSSYKSGDMLRGKDVLVVGCGNSGMEVCLDLCNHNATPSLVVRDTVNIQDYYFFSNFCLLLISFIKFLFASNKQNLPLPSVYYY